MRCPGFPANTVMIDHRVRNSGRFRTTMKNRGRGPKTSAANGSGAVFVRSSRPGLSTFSAAVACYVQSHPSLRGMSEVLYALPCRLQSVQEWLVPDSVRERDVSGMDLVLFLWNAGKFQPLEIGGDEALPGFQRRSSSRIRSAGRDCYCKGCPTSGRFCQKWGFEDSARPASAAICQP